MTREEAIEIFENKENYVGIQHIPGADIYISRGLAEAINVALTALRPVSRERVERMRGEWIVKHDKYNEITITECSKCGDETVYEFFFEENDSNFCPHCGAPMTDEAVQMVMERLEVLHEISPTT